MKVLLCAVALAAAAGFVRPALAAACAFDADEMVSAARAAGDTIAADFAAPGAHVDRLIVDIDRQAVWLWPVRGGCVIGPPVLLDRVPGKTPPPAPKPAPAPAAAAGPEIGI